MDLDDRPRGDGEKEFLRKKGRLFYPHSANAKARIKFSELDLTEPDDLETWLGEQLHDWQMVAESSMLKLIYELLEKMADELAEGREDISPGDLQRSGYIDGQINILDTVLSMLSKAQMSRNRKVGKVT